VIYSFFILGLVDYFTTLFFEVSAACFEGEDNSSVDNKVVLSMLQTLLETLHSLFKYVSDFVRKALQVGHQVGVIVCSVLTFSLMIF